uniref:uncharacterized protein LOC124018965 n=1 Tax=Oncorhynchus gorbuscha TaxID=8017 RepID=UPI001EAEACB9|nr:uncharacterized protein LOC124018965 [Oncorhynchus gorbuscha]
MGALTGLLSALVALLWTLPPGSLGEECSSFRHVENGRTFFRYSGLYVAFTCNPGYKIHGYRTNSCVSGQWTREPPVCVESDMMRSWKQKEPTVPMPRIQSQNLAVLSALKNHLQLHYNTIANTASKPVLLANAPRGPPHPPKRPTLHRPQHQSSPCGGEFERHQGSNRQRRGPEKPTRPQASTSSSATTETITSTSSLLVAEGYWHQGAFIPRLCRRIHYPGRGCFRGHPVGAWPGRQPADVSSTNTQEPYSSETH